MPEVARKTSALGTSISIFEMSACYRLVLSRDVAVFAGFYFFVVVVVLLLKPPKRLK